MTTAIAGNRMGFAVGLALLMMGLVMTTRAMPLAKVDWIPPTASAVTSTPQLYITSAVVPDPVQTLDRVTINTTFQSSAEVQEALAARLEVVGAGQVDPVLAMSQSGFQVPAEGARAVYWEWRVPESVPAGKYTLRVKVVGVESGRVYGESDRAATFTVAAR